MVMVYQQGMRWAVPVLCVAYTLSCPEQPSGFSHMWGVTACRGPAVTVAVTLLMGEAECRLRITIILSFTVNVRTKACHSASENGCINASSLYASCCNILTNKHVSNVFIYLLVQEVALDYIGKRGSAVGVVKEKRIQYAREILQRELFPHIGVEELFETKKVGSLGPVCICISDKRSATP